RLRALFTRRRPSPPRLGRQNPLGLQPLLLVRQPRQRQTKQTRRRQHRQRNPAAAIRLLEGDGAIHQKLVALLSATRTQFARERSANRKQCSYLVASPRADDSVQPRTLGPIQLDSLRRYPKADSQDRTAPEQEAKKSG